MRLYTMGVFYEKLVEAQANECRKIADELAEECGYAVDELYGIILNLEEDALCNDVDGIDIEYFKTVTRERDW